MTACMYITEGLTENPPVDYCKSSLSSTPYEGIEPVAFNRQGRRRGLHSTFLKTCAVIFVGTIFSLIGLLNSMAVAKETNLPSVSASDCWQETTHIPQNFQPALSLSFENSFPEKDWWNRFQDPILVNYVQEAINANRDLQVALARIKEARETVRFAFSRELPQMTLRSDFLRVKGTENFLRQESRGNAPGGGGNAIFPSDAFNIYDFVFSPRYEVDLFGKNWSRIRAAARESDAVKQDANALVLTITAEVATAYINLLQTDRTILLQAQLVAIQEENLRLRRSMFAQGVLNYDDVLGTEQSLSQAKKNLAETQKMREAFVHQLSVLRGRPPVDASGFVRSNLEQLPADLLVSSGLPSELVSRRPDILAAEARLKEAGFNIAVARKDFFPTLNLMGPFGFLSTELSRFFDSGSFLSTIAVNGAQTLFDGGAKIATYRTQKARHEQQINQYQQTILNAFREVEDALSGLISDKAQYDESRRATLDTRKRLGLTEHRYQQGVNTLLDVLDLRSQLVNNEITESQKKASLLAEYVNLYKAIGGGF